MKIKVYTTGTSFKIVNVSISDDVKTIADQYERWEYVL